MPSAPLAAPRRQALAEKSTNVRQEIPAILRKSAATKGPGAKSDHQASKVPAASPRPTTAIPASKRHLEADARSRPSKDPFFLVKSILAETTHGYLVDWFGDDVDGRPCAPTLEPKNFVSRALVTEWRAQCADDSRNDMENGSNSTSYRVARILKEVSWPELGKSYFLVLWAGYEKPTWEPEDHVDNADQAIAECRRRAALGGEQD